MTYSCHNLWDSKAKTGLDWAQIDDGIYHLETYAQASCFWVICVVFAVLQFLQNVIYYLRTSI